MSPPRSTTRPVTAQLEVPDSASRARAAAMPAEERRASILTATVPLLAAHGTDITTRQIADAAGVAEGTIFRVFTDKDTLIEAAVEQAFDPAPIEDELRSIDPTLSLDARCEAAVVIIQTGVASLWRILNALGGDARIKNQRAKNTRHRPSFLEALATVFEPDRDQLHMTPMEAADVLRCLTVANSHPALNEGAPMSPAHIASVILDGIRTHPEACTA